MILALKKIISKRLESEDFELKISNSLKHGHVSTNAAFVLAKKEGISLPNAAEEIRSYLHKNTSSEYFDHIEIDKGFVNMWLTPETITKELTAVLEAGIKWGKPKEKRKETVIIEYSSPNIAKHMHVGHLRSTVIGDSIARVFEFFGYKVVRWNYLGDWGTQFGKLIAAYKLWGSSVKAKTQLDKLNDLYVKFHQEVKDNPELEDRGREEFKKLEEGGKVNKALWKRFKKDSLKEFNKIYNQLGVNFSVNIGESFYDKESEATIELLVKEGIAKESEGALVINLDKFNLPTVMVRKSDGATLYTTREISNLKYRIKEYKPSKILYVVGNEQSLHFSQLFAIAKLLNLGEKVELSHVKHGMVSEGDGKKLSTREGRTIRLEELLSRAIELSEKTIKDRSSNFKKGEIKDITRTIAIGAVKYNDLSQNRLSDISFDWDKMLSFEGNSAPYLQYTYARLKSILRKAGPVSKKKLIPLENEQDQSLVLKLLEFPQALEQTLELYLPNYLANYLYELAKEINSFYHSEPVLNAESNIRLSRLNLVKASARTLKTGLKLLGIDTVERM